MQTETLYFAYGSNMSTKRLRARIASATVVDTASLHGHLFEFRKSGKDGSAKCDVEQTDYNHDRVQGVLFKIQTIDLHRLDQFEGRGHGYEQKQVKVVTRQGHTHHATTYYATHIDHSLAPYHWYKTHVLTGAREHKLPTDYIRMIEAITSVSDPDTGRQALELAIYHALSK